MIGFACGNPYGVIAAMHLARTMHSGEETALYLLHTAAFSREMAEKVENEGIFTLVRLIPDYKPSKRPNRLFAAVRRVFFEFERTRAVTRGFACDTLYFAWGDLPLLANIIRRVGRKKREACAFQFMEEGIGFYTREPVQMLHGWPKRLMILAGRMRWLKRADTLCVFEPKLLQGERRLRARTLPKIDFNDAALRGVISRLWPAQSEKLQCSDAVYLSQITLPKGYSGQYKKFCFDFDRGVVSLLDQAMPRERYAVKLHPRQKEVDIYPEETRVAAAFPLEAFLLQNDVSDKLLISVNSTALITPYLMFGQSPRLMILHPLFIQSMYEAEKRGEISIAPGSWVDRERQGGEQSGYIAIFRALQALYDDPARVVFPQSQEQALAALQAFAGN